MKIENRDIIDKKLLILSKSKFRTRFKLSNNDKKYVLDKGINKIIEHTYSFVNERLVPSKIINDGKQTPMRGHPVFVAQHATATCCRGCLSKWHHMDKDRELTNNEINYIVSIIITWIISEIKK